MKKAFPFFILFALTFAFFLFRQTAPQVESASRAAQSTDLSNYDIRLDKSEAARNSLLNFRRQANSDSSLLEARRKKLSDGETELRRRVSSLNIEYGERLQTPEVISIEVARNNPGEWLTAPSAARRAGILRSFLKQNPALFGLDEGQINALKTTADYTNPDGNLSFVHLEQEINGLRVFQGEVKAGFTGRGEIIRVINNLAPALDYQSLSIEAEISAERAVGEAAKSIGVQIDERDTKRIESGSSDKKARFERGQFTGETTVEKIYFPAASGAARLAWRILLWQQSDAFDVIIDARDGTLLWRKNITDYQTQAATYGVYANLGSFMKTADSPTPGTPGCLNPICPPPSIIGRLGLSLIGNEPPYIFNNLGWIPDGENRTIGNNAEAGIDRDGVNGVDPQGYAFGNPMQPPRFFSYNYNPAPGQPPPGEEPLPPQPQTYPPSAFQQGSVTNAFYVTNRFHDEMYLLGFTEPARNFQTDNFGRGGVGGDSISVEVQDSSGTNTANFATPGDGGRGRLQLYVWTAPTPDRDGALDNQMIVHELTHGVSNRLHGNASGLGNIMGVGMGEGWSDFYALALLAEPFDGTIAPYAYGGYSISGTASDAGNYYYGLRRFPYATILSNTVDRPHNPLTFGHLNQGNCSTFNSAFPPRFNDPANCGQAAFIGEVWATALWEVRHRFRVRLGFTDGNRKSLQLVTDGMKLAPLNPNMVQERDALLIAAQASSAAPEAQIDVADVWRGFALRGLGFGAAVISASAPVNVVESFAVPPQMLRRKRADFDGDGKTDVSVYRPNEGNWYLNRSTAGFSATKWGLSTDVPAPGDYDGDRKTDLAVYRPSNDGSQPDFYILRSADSTFSFVSWGIIGDKPVIADYDGDGKDDVAVFRASTLSFYVLKSTGGFMETVVDAPPVGTPNAVTGDFDGDGKADFAYTYTDPNTTYWIIRKSANGYARESFFHGNASDVRVPADYDGDGIDDLAVYRRNDGMWNIRKSTTNTVIFNQFGISTDVPVPGDYDGDGKEDQAVYRDGMWYINQSTAGFSAIQFGVSSDIPIPSRYLP
jgi:hypothetical protein